jgi:hypothetical protein
MPRYLRLRRFFVSDLVAVLDFDCDLGLVCCPALPAITRSSESAQLFKAVMAEYRAASFHLTFAKRSAKRRANEATSGQVATSWGGGILLRRENRLSNAKGTS